MIYDLRHRTTYHYGNSAVTFARCVLRLTPVSTPPDGAATPT